MNYKSKDTSKLPPLVVSINTNGAVDRGSDAVPELVRAMLSGYQGQACALYKSIGNELLPVRQTARVIVFSQKPPKGTPLFLLLFNGKHQYRQNPQGGVDEGEDYLKAGSRELQEETGITNMEFVDNSYAVQEYHSKRKGKDQWSVVHGVAAKVPYQDSVTLNEEDGHTHYGWFTYDEACERLTRFPEQLTLFQDVCRNAGLVK